MQIDEGLRRFYPETPDGTERRLVLAHLSDFDRVSYGLVPEILEETVLVDTGELTRELPERLR